MLDRGTWAAVKVKVVIVDLEVPARVKKWGLRLGIPIGVLLGGGAVAYAAGLVSFTAGQTLTAQDLNTNFTVLQNEITALQGANPLASCTMQTQVVATAVLAGSPGGYSATASCPAGSVATGCGFDTVAAATSCIAWPTGSENPGTTGTGGAATGCKAACATAANVNVTAFCTSFVCSRLDGGSQ